MEVCLRIFALGPRNYFLRRGKRSCSRNNVVNWVDFVVVVLSLILTIAPYYLRYCLEVSFFSDDERYCQKKRNLQSAIRNGTCMEQSDLELVSQYVC